MSAVDLAIERLQDLALASTDVTIKAAPDYPVSDAGVLPISIAYLSSGEADCMESSTVRFFPSVNVDFHFSSISLKNAYTQINACAAEFARRLGGDPTLDGSVDTITFPVSFIVGPAQWDSITTMLLRFTIPLKTLESPITTST